MAGALTSLACWRVSRGAGRRGTEPARDGREGMVRAVWRSASGSVMAVAWDVSAAEWSNMESSAGEGERGLRTDWGCA